jgi:hypothetical protein
MLRAIHSLNWAASKSHQRLRVVLHWSTEDIYIGYDSGAEVDRHLPRARDGGCRGRRKDGREKRRRREKFGGRGVFIIFQWLKDRKEPGGGGRVLIKREGTCPGDHKSYVYDVYA